MESGYVVSATGELYMFLIKNSLCSLILTHSSLKIVESYSMLNILFCLSSKYVSHRNSLIKIEFELFYEKSKNLKFLLRKGLA